NVGFTVGTVFATNGITSGNGNVTLRNNAGLLTIGTATAGTGINAGGGTVRLQSAGGITQTAQGVITASALGVLAVGDVNLCGATNAVTGPFPANDTLAGKSVMFRDASGFTVGQVMNSGIFASTVTGVMTTGNGDIDLVSTSGPITLAQAVNAGGGTVRINSGGAVAQTGGAGVITAQNLVVRAAGNVDLSQVSNNVP